MPTGYTAMIEEKGNTNAREYVESCARAFGLFIHQRDDSVDTAPKYPERNIHYQDRVNKSKKKLEDILSWSPEKISRKHISYRIDAEDRNADYIKQDKLAKDRYDKVRAKLNEWHPSNEINENIKKFALEQINISYPNYEPYEIEIIEDRDTWYAQEIDDAKSNLERDIEYFKKDSQRYADQVKNIDEFFLDLINVPA